MRITGFVVLLSLILSYCWFKEESNQDKGKTLSIEVSVDLVKEVVGEAPVFNHVYKGYNSFTWDSKTKRHKMCLGSTTPTTVKTTCIEDNRQVKILHYLDPKHNKIDNICIYVDFSNHECRIGDDTQFYYSEKEITF